MKHIALHILQPFPPSCLNRDDVGAPKSAIFGGVTRARISSQCLKRAIRLLAQENEKDRDAKLFAGSRTLRAADDLAVELGKLKVPEAAKVANEVCDGFLSKKKEAKEESKAKGKKGKTAEPVDEEAEADAKTSTLLYFSPGEIRAMAEAIATARKENKDIQEAASKAVKKFIRTDAADIAIFGRMVANDPSLNMEAAGLFNHAISTHACDNDLDFWTAMDDNKGPEEDAGAANMSHAEFNAACYYRYVALNLDLLYYQKNKSGEPSANLCGLLKPDDKKLRQEIVRAFLRAVILAVPTAKHTGMNANLPPEYILGLVTTGQPMQLVNAFEAPVRANGQGWLKPSVDALERHFERFKKMFGLDSFIREEVRLSEQTPINQFIEKLVGHVE